MWWQVQGRDGRANSASVDLPKIPESDLRKGRVMYVRQRLLSQAPYLLSVLRIVIALLFIEHGSMKLLGFPPSSQASPLTLLSLEGLSGALELVGGLLLLPGLFTRAVAFVLSGEMAAAYFIAHASKSFFPALNKGEAALIYSFLFLYLAAAGGGPWSIDRLRRLGGSPRPPIARPEVAREQVSPGTALKG
jgi:putative oxidoreductase